MAEPTAEEDANWLRRIAGLAEDGVQWRESAPIMRQIADRLSARARQAEADARIAAAASNDFFVSIVRGHRNGMADAAENHRMMGRGDLLDLSLRVMDAFLAAVDARPDAAGGEGSDG